MTIPSESIPVVAALFGFPQSIRDAVVELPGFKERHGLPSEAEINFGEPSLRFLRSRLFGAIRALYRDRSSSVEIANEDGVSAVLQLVEADGQTILRCTIGDRSFDLPSFALLSESSLDRLAEFDRLAAQNNLVDEVAVGMRARLSERPVSEEEFGDVRDELDACPNRVRQRIRDEISQGSGNLGTIVPPNPNYYDRLVGALGGTESLVDFVAGPARQHVDGLLRWDFPRGLSFALLLAGHSSISNLVEVGERESKDVEEAFAWLADRGSRFSQVAGVELGCRLIDRYPAIEPSLVQIVEDIRDDVPSSHESKTSLASSLFVLVSGELSRRGMLLDRPPFWRRLAAIAQAGMFERELLLARVDIPQFMQWATQGRGLAFYMQALADVRLEPRWLPDFASAEHLRAEFVSRMALAGEQLVENDGKLVELLKSGDGLRKLVSYPRSFLPGPLEGGSVAPLALPPELVAELEVEQTGSVLDSGALAGLVNASLVYKIDAEHSKLATRALKTVRHQVSLRRGDDESFSLLSGLAVVAAVTRTPDLMQDVKVVARVLRRRVGSTIEATALMRIGLIASAAHSDLDDWCRSVGEWFIELAFDTITDADTAEAVRAHLRQLCELQPRLWIYCARADAALAAAAQAA